MDNTQEKVAGDRGQVTGVSPLARWLTESAERHEAHGEPVWAMLYRQEVYLIEKRGD